MAAIAEMQMKEKKEHQIHSPNLIPVQDDIVDYTTIVKAWDKAQRGRSTVNMPAKENALK